LFTPRLSLLLLLLSGALLSFTVLVPLADDPAALRAAYSRPAAEWPAPTVDSAARPHFRELGELPRSPVAHTDSLKPLIELGKTLFFDPRLSGSGQISCSSCHDPERSFTDNRSTSVGHGHRLGKRNAPSLLNVWAVAPAPLFWDGRAATLEEQALMPVDDTLEMHQAVKKLPRKINGIKGYRPLFKQAYGTETIDGQRIAHALATFQRSLQGRRSRFDRFLGGHPEVFTDQEVLGLHLFRTKARCINCHNGPLFTDNQFHNDGLTYYGRELQDLGRYTVTQKPDDVGRFRTPSLREVMRTRPWMHNGLFDEMDGVLNMYNAGMPRVKRKAGQENDPLFPVTSPLLKPLGLSELEKEALIAFLNSITTTSYRIERPPLPR
jgi:cytochrome c peroxidase